MTNPRLVHGTIWRCTCSLDQATAWLNSHTDLALTKGDASAVLLAEVVGHYLLVVRRSSKGSRL